MKFRINIFPRIMGIVNVTPDSFSDGGKYFDSSAAINHALTLIDQGADIVDIGGESSRPGAQNISEAEEIGRVLPVIEAVRSINSEIPISIDTVKYSVAKVALSAGASMINDITGLKNEPRLAELAAEYNADLVIMHIQGSPRTMQSNPFYDDVVQDVFSQLSKQIEFAKSVGVRKIYADVGIGFGKIVEHNVELLKNHKKFLELGVPLLLGISRKSFLGKYLGIEKAENRDFATLAAHLLLLDSGAEIIRVHNVEIFSQARKLRELLN